MKRSPNVERADIDTRAAAPAKRTMSLRAPSSLYAKSGAVIDLSRMLDEFREAAERVGLLSHAVVLTPEHLAAPHRPPSRLQPHSTAVYVFSLSAAYGATVPAGPNRVIKVGKVGTNSAARFCSQHYLPHSAGSNVAKSLLTERVLWPYLGIQELDERSVKAWMCEHLDRDHIFIAGQPGLERDVERYFRGRLGPVFEG